jgi:hypothetical protein
MLIAFDLGRLVHINLGALYASPVIVSEKLRFSFRKVTMYRLSHATGFAANNEIPPGGFTDC